MLWVDKYRPRELDEVELYPELTDTLRRLAASSDLPHVLFYGPSGAGKKTRAMALLHAVYGAGVYAVKLEHKSIAVSDSKVVDMATLSSPHHIDMNPSDAGYYDRVIVMQMIRDIAQTVPLHTLTAVNTANTANTTTNGRHKDDDVVVKRDTTATSVLGADDDEDEDDEDDGGVRAQKLPTTTTSALPTRPAVVPYKVVVLNEVDRMSRGAQHALRRTMEKYMRTCRLVLLCNSTSRLIAPLRSRCLGIRVPAHDADNVRTALRRVCDGEGRGATVPSDAFVAALTQRSGGNLRRALLMYEAAVMTHVDVRGDGAGIPQADWQLYLDEIVRDVLDEQTPKRLHEVRLKFYDLLAQCIAGETILRTLTDGLLARLPTTHYAAVLQLAATYDHNMKLGTKPILHLEAFVANVMQLLKQRQTQH